MTSVSKTYRPNPPFLLRAIWFVLLGWHLTLYWIAIAWLLNVTIVGLPIGLWMIDRIPQVLTLQARRQMGISTGTGVQIRAVPQRPLPLRALYFVFVGIWLSLLWSAVAYLFSITIIGLPIGIWMFHRVPAVTTLQRN